MKHRARSTFELRGVDVERKVYFRLEEHVYRDYQEACIAADVAVSLGLGDVVVLDVAPGRFLYDSRTLARQVEVEPEEGAT